MNSNIEDKTAELLEKNIDVIAARSAKKVFELVKSYRKGMMSQAESVKTCRDFLGYLISYLRNKISDDKLNKSDFMKDLIVFEEGIASRRLRYAIDLNDFLYAILVFKNEVWEFIKENYTGGRYKIDDFFIIENKINNLFILHVIDLTNAYIKIQKEFMLSQEAAFKKWEKVVESAYNIELNIPCREAYAAVARIQAEAIARRLRFDEEKVYDIKMAAGEACGNAIEHGSSRRGVDIHYHITPTDLIIEVRDYGQGFTLPTEEIDLPLDLLSERGRGLFLMKALMDKVDINSAPGEGTLIVLDKKR